MSATRVICTLFAGGLLTHGTLSHAAAAVPLGRLFMTPESRATLERQRQLDTPTTHVSGGGRLDGVVTRSAGKTTVWINGQPQTANAADLPHEAASIGGLTTGAIRIHPHAPAQ